MAFTYDAVGNRLTGPAYPKAGSFVQNYAYDYENRIVSVIRQVTGDPNADTVTFKYDPFGRRIEKNVSTYENGLPTAYKYTYVYDNEDIILEVLERTQSGNTTTTTTAYTHGPGIDEPLSLARNSQTYYYHADGLGSITSMTDSTQAVVNRYSYDSFGMVQRAETVWNDFTYTGREYDYETGLYYYRARYYDPEAGRFVSKDPIGFAGGDVNLFNYVSGNPVNFIDPDGLNAITFDTLNSLKPLASQISMGDGPLPVGDAVALAILSGAGLYDLWHSFIMNEGIDDNTEMTDPSTWPVPPAKGECKVGEPSRSKPRKRGEKSLWDPQGGEWRPHKPDKYHPEGHWDYKSPGGRWHNIPVK